MLKSPAPPHAVQLRISIFISVNFFYMKYFFFFLLPLVCFAQNSRNYPPVITDAQEHIYKKASGIELKLWVYPPSQQEKKTAVILFFFGGGFRNGSPEQFIAQARYFASRGISAIVVDYRVFSRNQVKPIECLADAKDAIQWVRRNAEMLNISPNKIIASGGSAGGYLAAATYFVDREITGNVGEIDEKPNALVLFNPAGMDVSKINEASFTARFGAAKSECNLIELVGDKAPPTLILHGDKDKIVSISTVRNFTQKMNALGHNCTLVEYIGEPHGFFNYGRLTNGPFYHTIAEADAFLRGIGLLPSFPQTR